MERQEEPAAPVAEEAVRVEEVPARPIGRYVLALVLIGVLAMLSTFVTYRALSRQQHDTETLQQGLNQGLNARHLAEIGADPSRLGSTLAAAAEMEEVLLSISLAHDDLLGRLPDSKISGGEGDTLPRLLSQSVPPFEDMSEGAARMVIALRSGRVPSPQEVATLGTAAAAYDLAMRSFVVQSQQDAEQRSISTEQTQYFLLLATLALLVLEGLFLFRPAARNIRVKWRERTVAHQYERELNQQRLNYLARYDPLTGLINRTMFKDRLESAVARAKRNGTVLALMFLDIDGFKEINDHYGHATGDALLRQVGERLAEVVRDSDTVARLGGDEFTVILEGGKRVEDAGNVATKVLNLLSSPYRVGHHDLVVTTSIGIASYPLDGETASDLLKGADIAMYSAKAAGRNTYQFFTEELRERTTERLSLIEGLRRALDSSDQLHLVYQPKVDVANQTVIGLEALIRWNHPLIGEVPPSRFVPLAEETDLIIPLGDWVLDHVCLQMKRWLDQGLPPMRVSVNLSSRQFRTGNVVETVGAALAAADLDPRYLDVELTEGTIISDVAQTRRALERLREMGVTVSIDDFGTGYSSLGYLTQLPIDTLKIDRSFIAESLVGPDAGVISSAIIGLAKSLGLEVVAEGVETEEQLAFLQELGCTKVQGFAIARPMPSSKVLDFVAAFDGENQLVRRR